MSQENTLDARSNKMLIIAVAVVAVMVLFLYMRDRQQQRDFRLQRIEARVEVLEEWGGSKCTRAATPGSGKIT